MKPIKRTIRAGTGKGFSVSAFALVTATCSLAGWGCAASPKNEVIVMGMIHDGHKTSDRYGISAVQRYVRAIDPDYILCEIPPDRFEKAMDQFRRTGHVTEPRVRRFPEYVQAVFPLTQEMDFVIVPCAGWTKTMSDDRSAKLKKWKTTRPKDTEEVDRAEEEATREIQERGWSDDPVAIHSEAYDRIVKRGLEPYNRLFNEDLGAGGWDNINRSHYALIRASLDRHRGEGKRFLVMFGSWHKYWILEKLRKRPDIVLRKPQDYVAN